MPVDILMPRCTVEVSMTVVVNNASSTFVRALREMAKLDGASVIQGSTGLTGTRILDIAGASGLD